MSKKLFVKLQAPTIELEVKSTADPANEKASIIIGFKRFDLKNLEAKLNSFNEALKASLENADEFVKNDIVYIKNAIVEIYDEDTFALEETIEIPDTRIATPTSFWGDAKECLSVLVEHYLSSAPWKGPIYEAYGKAISNFEIKEEQAKN